MACCVSLMRAFVKIGTLLPATCRHCSLASGLVYQLIRQSPPSSLPDSLTRLPHCQRLSLVINVGYRAVRFWCPWRMSLGAPWAGQPNKISVQFCVRKGGGRASISVLTCYIIHAMSASSLINGPMCIMVPKYLRHGYMYPCNVCDGLFSYHSHVSVCLLFSMSLGILLPILLVRGLNGIHSGVQLAVF